MLKNKAQIARDLGVIFGQNHLIFGQALLKIFEQEASAPKQN